MSAPTRVVVAGALASALLLVLAGASTAQIDPGEEIMNRGCQNCHTVRAIPVQAMDADGWRQRVSAEIERGANVEPEEVPVLLTYLVSRHGALPDGPGKDVLLNTCTMCHELFRIKLGPRTSDEWEETLVTMLNEGAQLSDEDFARVHEYLSTNFGVD
jgi:cytochrome c5